MKILFASDIHGSAYYCRRLLDIYKETKASRMVILGDILYHGPRNDLSKGVCSKGSHCHVKSIKATTSTLYAATVIRK